MMGESSSARLTKRTLSGNVLAPRSLRGNFIRRFSPSSSTLTVISESALTVDMLIDVTAGGLVSIGGVAKARLAYGWPGDVDERGATSAWRGILMSLWAKIVTQ